MTDLEREAREAAERKAHFYATNKHPQKGHRATAAFDDYMSGYLAAAAPREQEIERLKAELADWEESARKAAGERCEDEIHCCCVPYLRVEIERLRARVAELEGMVPKWVNQSIEGGCAEFSALGDAKWKIADGRFRDAQWWSLMVPPIPLPETKA